MNMISTGAFLTEMDASNKQETLAEKFAAVWEKKNSKVARAGGVSLMALSLAACGSSDDTTTSTDTSTDTTTDTSTDTATDTTTDTTPVAPAATELVVATLSADTTLKTTSDIDGGAGTNDVLKLAMSADFAGFVVDPDAADTGSMVGFETVELTADSLARSFDATGVSGVTTYKVDGSNGGVVSIADSADLAALDLSNIASGAFSITYAAATGGTSPVAGADDTLNLTVAGLGSATADISITAAGVEKLAITSNAPATAAGTTNYLNLAAVDATDITVSGAADTDIAAVKQGTTDFDASGATGAVTAVLTNALPNALDTVKTGAGDDKVTLDANDLNAQGTIAMGDGADTLVMSSTAADTLQLTMSGVETLDITDMKAGATATVSLSNTTDLTTVALGSAAGTNNFGSATVNFVNATDALTINAVGESAAGTVSTDTTAAVTINIDSDADTTATSADASAAIFQADKAGSVTVDINGYMDQTGNISADKATTLTVNAEQSQSAVSIDAAKAETLNITAGDDMVITAGTYSSAKVVTIDSAGSTEIGALAALVNATLTGAGADATIATGAIGTATLANDVTITASGLKSGLDVDNGGNIKSAGNVTIDASGVTGGIDTGAITATGSATVKIGKGAAALEAIDAKAVTLDLSAGESTVAIGDGAGAGGADITSGSTVDITSNALAATSADIAGDKTSLTVTATGSLADDRLDISNTHANFTKYTVSGDFGLGSDIVNIAVADEAVTSGTVSQTVDVSGVKSAAITINVAAITDAADALTIIGTKDTASTDTVSIADTYDNAKITLTDIDALKVNNDISINASALSGQAIEISSAAGADTLTLDGTASADTIDLSSLTFAATKPIMTLDLSQGGADVVTLSDGAEAVIGKVTTAAAMTYMTITDFTVGINDSLDIATATALGTTAQADFGSVVTRTDGQVITSASVDAKGLVTLYAEAAGAGTTEVYAETAADMKAVATQLLGMTAVADKAVVFEVDADGDGTAEGSMVVAESNTAADIELFYLTDVVGDGLNATPTAGDITIA